MVLPLLLVVVGQQVFRMAATAAAKKAIQAVGGRIVKEIPKKLAGKKVGSGAAFAKLVKEKKPALQDKIGNLFTKKSKRVTQQSKGRLNKKEGIIAGVDRVAGAGRGNIVLGVGGGAAIAAPFVGAGISKYKTAQKEAALLAKNKNAEISKLRTDLKKARTEKMRIQIQKDIDKAVAVVEVARLKNKPTNEAPKTSVRPKTRPTSTNAPAKSLRPKARKP